MSSFLTTEDFKTPMHVSPLSQKRYQHGLRIKSDSAIAVNPIAEEIVIIGGVPTRKDERMYRDVSPQPLTQMSPTFGQKARSSLVKGRTFYPRGKVAESQGVATPRTMSIPGLRSPIDLSTYRRGSEAYMKSVPYDSIGVDWNESNPMSVTNRIYPSEIAAQDEEKRSIYPDPVIDEEDRALGDLGQIDVLKTILNELAASSDDELRQMGFAAVDLKKVRDLSAKSDAGKLSVFDSFAIYGLYNRFKKSGRPKPGVSVPVSPTLPTAPKAGFPWWGFALIGIAGVFAVGALLHEQRK